MMITNAPQILAILNLDVPTLPSAAMIMMLVPLTFATPLVVVHILLLIVLTVTNVQLIYVTTSKDVHMSLWIVMIIIFVLEISVLLP